MATAILIIEDEEEVCMLLKKILPAETYTVECALTLAEGLSKAQTQKPDIILLDNKLPDGLGMERIHDFKQISEHTHVIMISAMEHLKQNAMEQGAEQFIRKPFYSTQIMNAVHSLVH